MCDIHIITHKLTRDPNPYVLTHSENRHTRTGAGIAEVPWTIACGSENKQDAVFWRLAQFSPANIETKRFSLVQYLGVKASKRTLFRALKPAARQLVQVTEVMPDPRSHAR